jgi:sulfite oxidase
MPRLDESKHSLTIEMPSDKEKVYMLKDLKEKFEALKITAILQCPGNRRRHMTSEARSTNGLPRDVGGISTATRTGVRL